MKLHAAGPATYNTITAYGEDYVQVNAQRYQTSLIVLADRILDWPVEGFERLAEQSFALLLEEKPEIVLLGTGARQRFPHPRLTALLAHAGIGVEVMDLKAACRTYNILVAEERKVAAALLFR
ncbi:MAG TPA: Mth938-like domain-containing protein [Burkholderiales bacterium]